MNVKLKIYCRIDGVRENSPQVKKNLRLSFFFFKFPTKMVDKNISILGQLGLDCF